MVFFKKVKSVITAVLTVIALTVACVGLLATTTFRGQIKALVVRSGSMEPNLPVGSLVVSRKSTSYTTGDVITFSLGKTFVTHRIYALKDGLYQTKGDANKSPDTTLVSPTQIVGKLWFDIPFAGRVLVFVKTPVGFGLLIMLPALWIIIQEIFAIGRELESMQKAKVEARKKIVDMRVVPSQAKLQKQEQKEKHASKQRLIQAGTMLLIAVIGGVGGTKAYFSDVATSTNNQFAAGQFVANTLVINELLYNTDCPTPQNKQWLELWNGSNSDVDLKDWSLKDQNGNTVQIVNASTVIHSRIFALLSKSQNTWANGFLELLDKNNTVVDHVEYGGYTGSGAVGGSPSAAVNTSLERKTLGFDTASDTGYHAFDFVNRFPQTPGFALPDTQAVVLNEFQVAPDAGEFIEVYNRSSTSVDISGWTFTKGDGTTVLTTVPASTVLAAGARRTVTYSSGKLPDAIGKIYLKDNTGKIMDAFSYVKFAPASGSSWARIPDGSNSWQLDSSPTPNNPNIL